MRRSVRSRVCRRAGDRCEYCHMPARYDLTPIELDHIVAEQHRGKSHPANLAQICAHCNRHKGPNLAGIDPRTRKMVRLFNPRLDDWDDHFRWQLATLQGLTPIGRATVEVLAINADSRLAFRAALFAEGLEEEFA